MKRLSFIIAALLLTSILQAQKQDTQAFEPNKIKIEKTYKTPEKLSVDVIIKDSRTSSKVFSEKIIRSIASFIKESYPNTNINFIRNLRNDFNPETDKILVQIDIINYNVLRKGNQWNAKTIIDVVVIDLRTNQIKKYKERISHISTQVNKNGTQFAKQALNASFKIAVLKSVKYIEKSIHGETKYELIRSKQKSLTDKNKKIEEQTIPKETEHTEKNENIFVSDVDINIPTATEKNVNRYALIIGNEDYNSYQKGLTNESNVEFAERDAKTFKQYAEKTLGIPDENIILMINAQVVEFSKSIEKLNVITKNLGGDAEIYFYYAGHGFPDEETKEPYLIPVDVSGTDLNYAIPLNEVYQKLTEYPSKRVTIFLDACFSGGARNQGLVAARGVKVQPKVNLLKGNLIVFTASSGTQSSLPYKEQQHGLFTYYLLKKLQETNGNVSLSDLADYVNKQVAVKSVMINDKEQNPQVNISPDVENNWINWNIR
ncbi:caspase domain-containing protein [Bacteroidota bacterium]